MSERSPTTRFTARADAYGAYRPGYPPAALEALFEGLADPATLTIADIGAGTGISARALAERGARVLAIEPNAAMRAQGASDPRIEWIDGTAERTGLPENAVDLAVAFQAFHWFDAPAAFGEMSRIARRRTGLVQYERDERDACTAAYGGIVRRYATDDTEGLRARALESFASLAGGRLRRAEVESEQGLDLKAVLGRAESSSYLPRQGTAAEALRAELRAFFERFAVDGRVTLRMAVYVLTAES